MAKKDLTVREHLSTIQSDGGKARWANLSAEERSAQARKAVEARWAKKRAVDMAETGTGNTEKQDASPSSPRKKAKRKNEES